MNKATKIVVILMITTIILYTIVGVHKKIENEQKNIQSGDVLDSGDNENLYSDNEILISYEVSSGENEVVLRGTAEGTISTTTYMFENGKLINIMFEEEITSGDDELIENIYNYMKTDEEMSLVYSSIERNGNTITTFLKDEYIDAYGDATKNEIYSELLNSIVAKSN